MQLAVKYYKDMGGTYQDKTSSDNKLSKWSKEDWQTREEYDLNPRKANELIFSYANGRHCVAGHCDASRCRRGR